MRDEKHLSYRHQNFINQAAEENHLKSPKFTTANWINLLEQDA